jgi:hypothetical protein
LRQIIDAFREETFVGRGDMPLGVNAIPVKVKVTNNQYHKQTELVEINNETVKSSLKSS